MELPKSVMFAKKELFITTIPSMNNDPLRAPPNRLEKVPGQSAGLFQLQSVFTI